MTGDYTQPIFGRVIPDRVEISVQHRTLKLYWFKGCVLPNDARYIVYTNGVIIDNNGSNGKTYNMTTAELLSLRSFAVTAVPPELADQDVIGEEVNMFTKVSRDCVLPEDEYTCNLPGPYDITVRGVRPNFMPVSWSKSGYTIRRGSKFVADGKQHVALRVNDYRYFTNFDVRYARAAIRNTPCQPFRYVSYNTAQEVKDHLTYKLENIKINYHSS